jgi:hypothetical protein
MKDNLYWFRRLTDGCTKLHVSFHQLRTYLPALGWVEQLCAMSGPSALQQTACLLGGVSNLHNPRQSDCKGRATTGLALDRDVAAHHLAEAQRLRVVLLGFFASNAATAPSALR